MRVLLRGVMEYRGVLLLPHSLLPVRLSLLSRRTGEVRNALKVAYQIGGRMVPAVEGLGLRV